MISKNALIELVNTPNLDAATLINFQTQYITGLSNLINSQPQYISGLSKSSKSTFYLKRILGDEFATMLNYEQNNPHHCYDLLEHCLHTVSNLDNMKLAYTSAYLCFHISDEDYENYIHLCNLTKIAALFHDIGKPSVAGVNPKTGYSTFYGHAAASAEIAKRIFESVGFDEFEIDFMTWLIAHHDDFINWRGIEQLSGGKVANKHQQIITDDLVRNYISKYQNIDNPYIDHRWFACLIQLCMADVKAQSDVAVINFNDGRRFVDTMDRKLHTLQDISSYMIDIYNDGCWDVFLERMFS